METLRKYLNVSPEAQYHIFDSHQEKMISRGVSHQDQDYVEYNYNIHKNSKPKPGDVFLYRRPKKSTTNRKFNIYGGGVIDKITPPDRDGNVFAEIKLPFKLKTPLEQGNPIIEDFDWTSKTKVKGSWEHFWNQYGMNVINANDFWGLMENQEFIIPGNTDPKNPRISEAAEQILPTKDKLDLAGFQVDLEEDDDQKKAPISKSNPSVKLNGSHTDYSMLQQSKSSIGLQGEYLVLEMLREQYEGKGATIEHVAQTRGDGCGYDILVTTSDNCEIRVEVKTTTSSYIDGFYLTPVELNAARQCLFEEASKYMSYYIYRVYNFNPKNKTANIKVYDHFNDVDFRLAPTCWKVHIR